MKSNELDFVKSLTQTQQTEIRERLEYSKLSIYCFELDGEGYAVTMQHIDRSWLQFGDSSNGYKQARIRTSKRVKMALRNRRECRKLANYDTMWDRYIERIKELNGGKLPKQLNKGHMWECWLTEEAGQAWEPDRVPFWMGADLEANGTTYQIKGEGAEYFNESNLASALKWEAEQARA